MADTMTPSAESEAMTAGQIGKIQDLLGAGLRKAGLQSGPTQRVIEHQGDVLVAQLVAVIRGLVEAVSNLIVRRVSVNRTRTPQAVIDATGRRQYTDRAVVDSMPRGTGVEVEVVFFRPRPEAYVDGLISDDRLEGELTYFNLDPAFPDDVAAVNEADPDFADTYPNGTHWQDKDGRWCYAAFSRWGGGRCVLVRRDGVGWNGGCWFAGRRKSATGGH